MAKRVRPAEQQARAAGASISGLVQPCDAPGIRVPSPDDGFAVALSGGGFRASLAGVGVLRFFASAGLLDRVRVVSSVSGGGVANGLFATTYERLAADGFSLGRFDELITLPLLRAVTERNLTRKLVFGLWKTIGPKTRAGLLADAFDDWLFDGVELAALPSACRCVFNAANLTTSVNFVFERTRVGDYVTGYADPAGSGLRVAQAVAMSASVPGFFGASRLPKTIDLPCDDARPPRLVDGGVYDNLADEAIDHLRGPCLVLLNAGGIFRVGGFGGIPVVSLLMRSQGVLYRQSTALRMRTMVERFQAWEGATTDPPPFARRGVVFGLATTMTPTDEWADRRPDVSDPQRLAFQPTSFANFPSDVANQLVYRGWWLTGANLTKYHRELVPETMPTWTDPKARS